MTKHSHCPYTSTYSFTPHNTNIKHSIHHIRYTNTQHTSTLKGSKSPLFLTTAATQQTFPQTPHTVTTTYIKHITSSEEILPRLTRRTIAQLRTNKYPFFKSYLHKADAKSRPSPLCPLCNTRHTQSLQQLHPHTHHIVTTGFVDKPRLERWSCWPNVRISWLVDQKRDDRTPRPSHKQRSREWVDNNNTIKFIEVKKIKPF